MFIARLRCPVLAAGRRMASSTVLVEEKGDKAIITLNRPKALNALNLEMIRQIDPAMRTFERNKSLVIMRGAGDKSFCAGGDVRALVENGPTPESRNFFREEYALNALIGTYTIPFVAIIDGITMGGGVGLSVHGQYRVATERTLFAMPETAIGLFPDVGGSYFLPRLGGKLGLFLGLTGYRLKGRDVQKCGVATHYCDSSRLPELEAALLATKNEKEIVSVLNKICPVDGTEFVLAKQLEQIDRCFGGETVEIIFEALKKDGTDWAKSTLKSLSKMSPTSMKVTQAQLERGANLDLIECLQMEFLMAVHHLEDSDFKEGVRSVLIDKDHQPKWSPSTLEAVTKDRVEFFFSPLADNDELTL